MEKWTIHRIFSKESLIKNSLVICKQRLCRQGFDISWKKNVKPVNFLFISKNKTPNL